MEKKGGKPGKIGSPSGPGQPRERKRPRGLRPERRENSRKNEDRKDQGEGARRKRERDQGQIGPKNLSFCLTAASVFVGTVSTCIGWGKGRNALGGCNAEIPQFKFAFGEKHEAVNNLRCKVAMALTRPTPLNGLQGKQDRQCSNCCAKDPPQLSLTSCPPTKTHADQNEQMTEGTKRLRSTPQ